MNLEPFEDKPKHMFGVTAERTNEIFNAAKAALIAAGNTGVTTNILAQAVIKEAATINEVGACLLILHKIVERMKIEAMVEKLGTDAGEITDELSAGIDKALDSVANALKKWAAAPAEEKKADSKPAPEAE